MVVIYNVDVGSCEIDARLVEVAESTSEAAAKVWKTERETTVSEYVLADEVLTFEGSVFCRRKVYLRPNLLHTETLQSAPAKFTSFFACAEGCWRRHHRRTFVSSQLASRSMKEACQS
jgi:hypothetical protein